MFKLQYFAQLPISFAYDATFEFGWIKGDNATANKTTEEALQANVSTPYNIDVAS